MSLETRFSLLSCSKVGTKDCFPDLDGRRRSSPAGMSPSFVRGVLHACFELLESVFMGFFLVDQKLHVVLTSKRENKTTSLFYHVTNLFQRFHHCPKGCGTFSLELPPQRGSWCISMIMNFFPMKIAFNFDNCLKLFRS